MFVFPLHATTYQPLAPLTHLEEVVWTERYRDVGEFTLVFDDYIKALELLPLGCLISQNYTREIMIVENHEAVRDKERNLKVTVTGRSFDSYLEQRTSVFNNNGPNRLFAMNAAMHAVTLLQYALTTGLQDAGDIIPNLSIVNGASTPTAVESREFRRGPLLSVLQELLSIGDQGLKIWRPLPAETNIQVIVHDGVNRTSTVTFSDTDEDLVNARYFWSNRNHKQYAIASTDNWTAYQQAVDVVTPITGLARRVLFVDANDIQEDDIPTLDNIMRQRALQELGSTKKTSLMSTGISSSADPKYHTDYEVGDIVTVYGEFGVVQPMRVVEHMTTYDSDGLAGVPSLRSL